MSIKEYIKLDLPFYHITPTRNLSSIFEIGLEKGNKRGICVVRSKHMAILKYITELMLINEGDTEFSVIEIIASQHGLQYSEVKNDDVMEITNPIHNYILRKSIIINPEDVVCYYSADPLGIKDKARYEEELIDMGLIEPRLT